MLVQSPIQAPKRVDDERAAPEDMRAAHRREHRQRQCRQERDHGRREIEKLREPRLPGDADQ